MDSLTGHTEEVLDVAFDPCGQRVVTASMDGTARVYDVQTHELITALEGHDGEVSKVRGVILRVHYTYNTIAREECICW